MAAQKPTPASLDSPTNTPLVVKYIGNNSGLWDQYYLDLIEAALKITANEGPYRIDYTDEALSTLRKRELLAAGVRVNIDRMTGFNSLHNPQDGFIRVKVPLMRGIHGFRVLLIRSQQQSEFDKVKTLADLRKLTMGFGRGWEGYLYQHEGINVMDAQDMSALLKMLAAGRFDYIPLAATEIEDSFSIDNKPVSSLVAEKHLLLYMPLPIFFYVSDKTPELAKRIEKGLLVMDERGEMKAIFDKYFAERLKKLHLSQRTIIQIPNFEDDGSAGTMDKEFLKDY